MGVAVKNRVWWAALSGSIYLSFANNFSRHMNENDCAITYLAKKDRAMSKRGSVNKGSRPVIFIEALKKMVIKLDHVEDLSSANSGSFYSSFQVCFRLSYCNIKAFFRSEFGCFLNIKNQDFLGEKWH